MKHLLRTVLVLCLILCTAVSSCAFADSLGFGLVNAGDVALRKDAGGQKITRLPAGTSVWITGSKQDSRGEMWYQVRTQEDTKSGLVNRKGWIKAEFVDAGSALWHDVASVRAANFGMIALKTDGTVLCAGNVLPDAQARYSALRAVRQAGPCTVGWQFYAVDGDGRLFRDGIQSSQVKGGIRLISSDDLLCITKDNRLQVTYEGDSRIEWVWPRSGGEALLPRVTDMAGSTFRCLLLTDDGRVCAVNIGEYPEEYGPDPDWETWTDVACIEASICSSGTYVLGGHTLTRYVPAFAAVRKDGAVLASPAGLAAVTAGWQGIRKVSIGTDWILGLKQDGTVIAAGIDGGVPPDVSGWTDIKDISNGYTWCAGVRNDGTVVFAGEFAFGD